MVQLGDPSNSSTYRGPDVSFLHVRVSALLRTNARRECILWEKTQAIPTQYVPGQKPDVWRKLWVFQKTKQFFFCCALFLMLPSYMLLWSDKKAPFLFLYNFYSLMNYLITVLVSVVEYYFVCNTDSGYFSLICNKVIRTLYIYILKL